MRLMRFLCHIYQISEIAFSSREKNVIAIVKIFYLILFYAPVNSDEKRNSERPYMVQQLPTMHKINYFEFFPLQSTMSKSCLNKI